MSDGPEALHRAIADTVRTGIKPLDFNVSPWPNARALESENRIEVWPDADYLNYYELSDSDDGLVPVRWKLKIDLSVMDAETAFGTMTNLLGWDTPSSLRRVLMAERSLSGRADDTVVVSAEWDAEGLAQTAWVHGYSIVSKG